MMLLRILMAEEQTTVFHSTFMLEPPMDRSLTHEREMKLKHTAIIAH